MVLENRIDRWLGALAGLALGATDTLLFVVLGTDFSMGGRDVTLLVSGAFTSSTILLGFLFGLTMESRRRERRAAAELDTARAQIAQKEKLASLGQLASAIAHEVKNPLAIIRSTVQNLAETLPADDGESKESAAFVLEEIDRLSKVTTSLVAFARPIKIDRRRTPCVDIIEKTKLLAHRMLAERAISLESRLDAPGAVDADRDLVCQVLLGLLGNAAEVTPPGGTIRLEAVQREDVVEMAVADRGPGVPDDLADRIFEPFFTTRESGSGLGLAVARQIVQAHEGEIGVEGADGGGARFVVRLKRAA